jgi:hypothetical protein
MWIDQRLQLKMSAIAADATCAESKPELDSGDGRVGSMPALPANVQQVDLGPLKPFEDAYMQAVAHHLNALAPWWAVNRRTARRASRS